VRVLHRPRKLGLGSAYEDAFRIGPQRRLRSFLWRWTRTGSHLASNLQDIIDAARGCGGLAIGSRYIRGGTGDGLARLFATSCRGPRNIYLPRPARAADPMTARPASAATTREAAAADRPGRRRLAGVLVPDRDGAPDKAGLGVSSRRDPDPVRGSHRGAASKKLSQGEVRAGAVDGASP